MPIRGHFKAPIKKDSSDFEFIQNLTTGSSSSLAEYKEDSLNRTWIAKSSVQTDSTSTLKDVQLEFVANRIYSYFGIATQNLCFSDLNFRGVTTDVLFSIPDSENIPRSGCHLLTEKILHFNPLNHYPVFSKETEYKVTVPSSSKQLPLRGLGAILAVASVIGDLDVIGGSGGNVGYVVVRDQYGEPEYAQAIKVDPGHAFTERQNCPEANKALIQIANAKNEKADLVDPKSLPEPIYSEYFETLSLLIDFGLDDWGLFFEDNDSGLLAELDLPEMLEGSIQRREKSEIIDLIKANINYLKSIHSEEIEFYRAIINKRESDFIEHSKKQHLENNFISGIVSPKPTPIQDAYIALELQGRESKIVNIDALFSDSQLESESRAIKSRELSSNNSDSNSGSAGAAAASALESEQSTNSQVEEDHPEFKIIVEGAAGIGKSTLAKLIAYRHTAEGLWSDKFKQLIVIPIRKLNAHHFPVGREYSFADIIGLLYYGQLASAGFKAKIVAQIDFKQTLFIIDGLDEANIIPEHLKSIFNGLLNTPNHLILMRPSGKTFLNNTSRKTFKLLGLDTEHQKELIQKTAKPSDVNQITQYIHANPVLRNISASPMLLELLCISFSMGNGHNAGEMESKGSDDVSRREDHVINPEYIKLSDLYHQFIQCLGVRWLQRQGVATSKLKQSEIAIALKPYNTFLTQFAKETLGIIIGSELQVQIEFPFSKLKEVYLECDFEDSLTLSPEDFILNLVQMGLLIPVGFGSDHTPVYQFLHLSFHEYFLAKSNCSADRAGLGSAARFLANQYVTLNFLTEFVGEDEMSDIFRSISKDSDSTRFSHTYLTEALMAGGLALSRALIKSGVNLNPPSFAFSAITEACRLNYPEMLKLLIDFGANFEPLSSKKQILDEQYAHFPLVMSVASNSLDCLKVMFEKGVDTRFKFGKNRTFIHEAARYGLGVPFECLEYLKDLKDRGLPLDAPDENGNTPAHYAAVRENGAGFLEALYRCDANLNLPNNMGMTILHISFIFGHLELIPKVSKWGLDIMALDHQDLTPVHYAALYQKGAVLDYLKQTGLDLSSILNSRQQNLAHVFAQSSNQQYVKSIQHDRLTLKLHRDLDYDPESEESGFGGIGLMLDMFMMAGKGGRFYTYLKNDCDIDLNTQDAFGRTPMHYAALNIEAGLNHVMELMELGVNIDSVDQNGFTPAYYAWQNYLFKLEHPKLEIETPYLFFAKYGEVANAIDSHGRSRLMMAIIKQEGQVVIILLEEIKYWSQYLPTQNTLPDPSNIDFKDSHGRTALNIAVKMKRFQYIEPLLKAGASITSEIVNLIDSLDDFVTRVQIKALFEKYKDQKRDLSRSVATAIQQVVSESNENNYGTEEWLNEID